MPVLMNSRNDQSHGFLVFSLLKNPTFQLGQQSKEIELMSSSFKPISFDNKCHFLHKERDKF